MGTPAPLWAEVMFLIFAPPVGTCVWWLMSRGWAMGVQGGQISERTRQRQRKEFWILLWVVYAIVAAILGASWLGYRP